MIEDIDLTLQSLNYPKKEIKNLLPILLEGIKKTNPSQLNPKNVTFENLLKEAMNHLDKSSNLSL